MGASRLAAIAFATLVFGNAIAAEPVAFVTDVLGEAIVSGKGKLAFLAEVAPGAQLVLAGGARVTLMYAASGAEFTMKGPGEYAVESAQVRSVKGAAPERRDVPKFTSNAAIARVSQSATASLRMRSAAAPGPRKTGLVYPLDTQVATLAPRLRWNGEGGTQGFTVVVMTAERREIWKGTSQASSLAASKRLSPATRYSWSVSSGGAILGESSFETLPAESIARAEKSRASAKSFTDRVRHALVLHELGATQDAREAWSALAEERPDLPELVTLAR